MKIKKLLALVMAMAMVMNLATVAMAAEDVVKDGTTGDGDVEFVYNSNVFQVQLSTVPENDTTFDFYLDPMGVVYDTQDDTNVKVTTEDATVYFANKVDGTVTYSSTSDAYTIINKSSFGVVITVGAHVKNEAAAVTSGEIKVNFVEKDAMKMTENGADAAELYLALVSGEDTYAIKNDTYAGELEIEIEELEDAYEVKYANGTYTYNLKTGLDWSAQTVDIQLTGACNDHVNWSKLGEIAPQVEITWTVNPEAGITDYENKNAGGNQDSGNQGGNQGGSQGSGSQGSGSASVANLTITSATTGNQTTTITFTDAATSITSMTYKLNGSDSFTSLSTMYRSVSGTTLTLKSSHISKVVQAGGCTYTVTFNDGSTATFTVTVTG